jgi:GNAT superfamily N-acetyltransferase
MVQFSELQVVRLIEEKNKIQCKVDDFIEWGRPALDQECYQEKELIQRSTKFSKDGSIFWALVNRSSCGEEVPTGSPIYCHLETHKFNCMFKKSNGEVIHGYSHHIASVFTLPEYRGQGLASGFLKEIATQMAALPNAIGSTLYSDIGPSYYDKKGWRVYPSESAVLEVKPLNASMLAASTTDIGEKLFLNDNLQQFLDEDNKRLEASLDDPKYDGKEVFVPLPSRDSIEWQFSIGVYYAKIRDFQEFPTQCGLKLNGDAFVIWCHNLKESTLFVVRSRFSNDPQAVSTLLKACIDEASKFKLKYVKIWQPASPVYNKEVCKIFDIKRIQREESLSSLMVFKQHRDTSLQEDPIWLCNEKFAWV